MNSAGGSLAIAAFLAAACADDSGDVASGPRFTLLPSSYTGVTFRNELPENPSMNGFVYEYYYNGGGVAVGDLTGDGLPELYFTSNLTGNRLYLNRGEMRFEDVTERAGVRGRPAWATGVTFADVNGDSRLDIYVSYSGPEGDPEARRNLLYMNQGVRDGIPTFTEQAAAYGLDDPGHATQGIFMDYDRDGDLDMYLMNHGVNVHRSVVELRLRRSPYEVDRLYRNDGNRFTDLTDEAGLIDTNLGYGLGASAGDLNNDGWPDLYVANDYAGRDYLYLGQPDGRFVEVLERAMGHIPYASMGSDIADFDGDGWFDVAVVEMAMDAHYDRKASESGLEWERFTDAFQEGQHYQYAANALQWNRGVRDSGEPVFSEVANLAGVARSDWSWAALFADLDNSGRPDLVVTTGIAGNYINVDYNDYRRRRIAEVIAAEGRVTPSLFIEFLENLPRRKVPNYAFRNEGALTFTNRTVEWGLDEPSYSHGAVYADLDRNGTLDLVVNNLRDEAFVYRNNGRSSEGEHYLAVRFEGPTGNPFGIGTRLRMKAGGRWQMQELYLTRGYQASVEPVLHFGLGATEVVDTVEVIWPDGARETRTAMAADRYLTLAYRDAKPADPLAADSAPPLFGDARAALFPVPRHHASAAVTDSQLEPYPSRRDEIALAAGDLDGDELEDFFFGGSGDEPSRIYLQQADGAFRGVTPWPVSSTEHVAAAAIFDANGDSRNDLWIITRDTTALEGPQHRHRLYWNEGAMRFVEATMAVPPAREGDVVLAAADFDRDNRVDLFIGNRSIPGRGDGPGSTLLRNEGGAFRDVSSERAPSLGRLQTVTDAVWADVTGNREPDLVLAGEWIPVTILVNIDGRLQDQTQAAGISEFTGWWQSVAVTDVNGDGKLDIVAGNLGLNYPYHPTADAPFKLYVNDFGSRGRTMAVPAYHEGGVRYPWFGRTRLAADLPILLQRYPTHDLFARATLENVFGTGPLREAQQYEVQTLATTIFKNLGDGRFEPEQLPRAAQISPVMGIVSGDFNRDGANDLVLAGNLEEMEANIPKLDAGVGLFLRGDGTGAFQPVPPVESGLLLEGRVRRIIRVGNGIVAGVAGGNALHVQISMH